MSDDPIHDPQLIDLRNNGTVGLSIDGRRFELKRPKVGEFARLRESYLRMLDELGEMAEDDVARIRVIEERLEVLKPRRERTEGEPLTDDEEAEFRKLRAESRTILRDQQERASHDRLQWFREAFDALVLRGGSLPQNDDDLEPWLAAADFQSKLVVHWMSVPLARGR